MGRSLKVTNGRMREKGGGVRLRKEVDRKRDKKKTQEEITISKKSFMILEILMTFIFSIQNSASFHHCLSCPLAFRAATKDLHSSF